MTTKPTLTQVHTGNGEPDLYRDAAGRAYWADGSRLRLDDCEGEEAMDVLMPILARERLTVVDTIDDEGCELMAARVDL